MSPFIETIKLLDGKLLNLAYHQDRFNRARREILGMEIHPRLSDVISIPEDFSRGLHKCRIIYGEEINLVEFIPHIPMRISSLKLVESNSISYSHKFSDRSALSELFDRKGKCDDILIVRNGCISDSYFANVALWDGNNWYTPDTPLLAGTMRASLLDNGTLNESRIERKDLGKFVKIRLINALNDLSGGNDIPLKAVT